MNKILGCVTEEEISYWGNDVSHMTKPDVASCRSSCSSMGASYFTYIRDDTMCYCKDSNAGRRPLGGHVSGETSCTGEFRLQNISFKKCLFFNSTIWWMSTCCLLSLPIFAWTCRQIQMSYLSSTYFENGMLKSVKILLFCLLLCPAWPGEGKRKTISNSQTFISPFPSLIIKVGTATAWSIVDWNLSVLAWQIWDNQPGCTILNKYRCNTNKM